MNIRHEPERGRFFVSLGDGEGVLTYRKTGEDRLDFTRTFVPPEHRRQGIGASLVLAGLGFARAKGKRVIPTCPFVATVVEEHPEYRDLLVE